MGATDAMVVLVLTEVDGGDVLLYELMDLQGRAMEDVPDPSPLSGSSCLLTAWRIEKVLYVMPLESLPVRDLDTPLRAQAPT